MKQVAAWGRRWQRVTVGYHLALQAVVFLLQQRQIRRDRRLRDAHQSARHPLEQIGTFHVAVVVHEQVHQQLPIAALGLEASKHHRALCHVHRVPCSAATCEHVPGRNKNGLTGTDCLLQSNALKRCRLRCFREAYLPGIP